MPTNVTVEYIKAQERYAKAKTREEKITGLEEMISTCPKHKGCETLLAELKSKLSKLKKTAPKKTGKRITTIPKEGDAQVCIIGLTQSGKSTLLSKLTNAKPKISSIPYTTTKPEVGVLNYHGVIIQLVEIPSTFEPVHMNMAQNCDGLIILYKDNNELDELNGIVERFRIKTPHIFLKRSNDYAKIKDEIWNILGLIKVYTKEPGKPAEKKPLVIKRGTAVGEAAKHLHRDFYEFFKFARIWGKSAKHQGQSVGKDHILKDDDILEIHI
ncbi:MAG: TGS domain-containing protein [Candidatus Aenigmarchaeota archaeon]|nr:TGS domain-containing protein [Candidatus Aenigmarchaeota archaeon]